jgi:hypothetical protein
LQAFWAHPTPLFRSLKPGAPIDAAQKQVATFANAALTALHWQIGDRVHRAVLDGKRAEYGAKIVATVSRQLAERYGRGLDEKSLRRMVQFAQAFPDREIVATLWRQLSSGVHFVLGFAAMRATRNWGMIRSGETLEA